MIAFGKLRDRRPHRTDLCTLPLGHWFVSFLSILLSAITMARSNSTAYPLIILVIFAFCLASNGVYAFGAGNIPSYVPITLMRS
jgi:NAD/NADP transhydrogenase beta subunit